MIFLANEHRLKIGTVKNVNDLPFENRIKKLVEQNELSISQALIEIAMQYAEFFNSENEEVYATVKVNDKKENYNVNDSRFKNFLRMNYYKIFKKPIGGVILKETIDTITAIESFNLKNYQNTYIRIAGSKNNTIYIDLGSPNREVVEVNRDGWKIINDSPVKFIRPRTMKALPNPSKYGSISSLDEFININEQDKILLYSFLLNCFSPTGPYPILIFQGPQGSGKSFISKLIKNIVDPSFAPIRSLPKNEEDLMISAQNSRLLAFDNLSGVGLKMADSLCKLATGGGFTTRKFFKNTEEVVIESHRPLILNGIDFIARRPDLASRAIIINLSPINNKERLTEEEMLNKIELLKPKILGALLDALSIALRNYNDVKLDSTPRMADFAKFATAAEVGFGFEKGTFLKEYERNQKETAEEAVEHDLLVSTIIDCLEREKRISGTATFILEKLRKYISLEAQTSKQWIKSSNQLKDQLTRVQPVLTANGVNYYYRRTGSARIHTLEKF